MTETKKKTYTADEVAKLIADKADASFKAGYVKAKETDGVAPSATTIPKDITKELETLRVFKTKQETKDAMIKIANNLPEDFNIKETGKSRFVKEFYSDLKDKTGEDFKKALETLKNDKNNALYFGDDITKKVTPVTTFNTAAKTDKNEPQTEYYPGTTIKKTP